MVQIDKVSQITTAEIADYIGLESPLLPEEEKYLATTLSVAKTFIQNYTGVKDLDTHADFVIVVYVLCQDMYDNRTLYVDRSDINRVVETILGMHSVNLL